jgi:GT2 family glycosyltransferase
MTSPDVSVVMPVHNGQRWLSQAIDSILAQGHRNFELIVIDDGSQDRTPVILDGFARRDSRVRIVTQLKLGVALALNRGIAVASAPLIARLDADDIALPSRLELQLAEFRQRSGLVLLGSLAEKIDDQGQHLGTLGRDDPRRDLKAELRSRNPFVHSSVMFDRTVAQRCGGYRIAFEGAEDFDLWLRMSEQGDVAILPRILMQYRLHGSNVSSTKAVRQVISTRLAIQCAALRAEGLPDPTDAWTGTPDQKTLLATEAVADVGRLLGLLQCAENEGASIPLAEVRSALMLRLSHRERKVAQYAISNLLAGPDLPVLSRLELIGRLFLLHPARATTMMVRGLVGNGRQTEITP